MSKVIKEDAFLKQQLGGSYVHIPFENLKMSMCVCHISLAADTNVNYKSVWKYLEPSPLKPQTNINENTKKTPKKTPNKNIKKNLKKNIKGQLGSYGKIIGMKYISQTKGAYPLSKKEAFPNSISVILSLKTKNVNIKLNKNGCHISGCKKFNDSADASRCIVIMLKKLQDEVPDNIIIYDKYPIVTSITFSLTNYHFNIGVALNLTKLDTFIHNTRNDIVSIYDRNIDNVSLRLAIPKLNILFTVNHTGSIKLGIGKDAIELIHDKLKKGYELFYEILKEFLSH